MNGVSGKRDEKTGSPVLRLRLDGEYAALQDVYAAKYECMVKNGVIVYTGKDVKPYVDYVREKYGEDCMARFRRPRGKAG